MTIINDYLEHTVHWKKQYGEKTLVLMQVGSFYEVYALKDGGGKLVGSNIEDFSRINDMLIANKNVRVKGPVKDITESTQMFSVAMAGFGLTQLDKYVGKLQENGYTVAVYNQDIQGKNTTRSLSEIISPGTYFSPDNTSPTNHTMCIWLERSRANKFMPSQITAGISWIDIFTGKTNLSQFTREYNHNPCTYDELERLVAINNPSECILVTNLDGEYLEDIVNYAGISSVKVHKVILDSGSEMAEFADKAQKQNYQQSVCNQYFPTMSSDYLINIFPTHLLAVQSFIFLLDFIYKQNPSLVYKLSLPTIDNTEDNLRLANHSLQQLNIIDEGRHHGKLKSVGDLLNNCVTVMGQRQFLYNLNNPTTNKEELNMSYDITDVVLTKELWKGYREKLNGIHDLEKLKRKMIIKKITPKDFSVFYSDLMSIISLDKSIKGEEEVLLYVEKVRNKGRQTPASESIKDLCECLATDLARHFYLEKCLDINNVSTEYLSSLCIDKLSFIKPGICEEVDSLLEGCVDSRKKLEAISKWLSNKVGSIEKKAKTTTFIKIHETPKTDPVLMGTKRRMTLLKSVLEKESAKKTPLEYEDFSGKVQHFMFTYDDLVYITMGSNKKDLVVTNPDIRTLTTKIQQAETKLVSATLAYYRGYVEEFVKYQEHFTEISDFVSTIDLLQCKGYIANKYNYCKPTIVSSEKPFFSMKELRHPLIEHLQTKEIYVTNDVCMGEAGDKDGMLLYGTNAVGKTSLIKSIGVNVIMAQAGLYVACSEMEYYPYQSIFTRILGNDNIFKGLSTFEVEMSELCTILKLADEDSLILGDELCSGTESDSALSIFTASLETLHERKSTFLFATHFHEIQKYGEIGELDRMVSKHMEVTYNAQKDLLVYDRKLRDGAGDSMYGLEVCKSLHLPDTFLERAHSIRMKYNKTKRGILSEEGSHFNVKKIGGICEMCREERGTDTHHLQHQKGANMRNSYIGSFHKNHKANLMTLCEGCHHKIHNTDEQHKRIKTSEGYTLECVSDK